MAKGVECLEHVAGPQSRRAKATNTQEIEHDRSADQVATGWPGPGERERAAPLHLFISFFLCLFVYLLRCLFVACYNVAINPPKESRNAPC